MTIFDIKRYAIHDGPGIRTTIFFKGCPLRCVWCHNPESWSALPQKTYKRKKCIGCGSCLAACPVGAIRRGAEGIEPTPGVECLRCGRCAEVCPTMALEMCGCEYTLEALLAEVEKERDIMQDSGGGVTLCGGEPLLSVGQTRGSAPTIGQTQESVPTILSLLRALGSRGFHRCIDTTLYAPAEVVREVARECELFLVDLKVMDSERHRRLTGVPNERILQNIRLLDEMGAAFQIRIPLIEGVNADEANIEATARFLATLKTHPQPLPVREGSSALVHKVALLPYHDVGRDKHHRLWSVYNPDGLPMATPTDDTLQRCVAQFARHGIAAKVGG